MQKELHDRILKLKLEELELKKQNKDTSHIDEEIEKMKKEYAKNKIEEIRKDGKYKK